VSAEPTALSSWHSFARPPWFDRGALVYFRGWRKVRPSIPLRYRRSRLACFFRGALAAIYLSLASPLDAFASFLLSAHMVQHMLLTMAAPPSCFLAHPSCPCYAAFRDELRVGCLGHFFSGHC